MAQRVSDKGLRKIAHFVRGIDNMSRDTDMERDQLGNVVAARDARNVDFDDDGNASRRRGFSRVQPLWSHSAFCEPGWPFGLIVYNGALCMLSSAGEVTPLVSGMTPWDEVTYAALGDRILWSNGIQSGVVNIDGEPGPLGVEVPYQPMVTAAAAGSLDEGTYFVAFTWQRAGGEESGAFEPIEVYVPEGGGIQLSDIPQPDDPTIERMCVYVSTANGGGIEGEIGMADVEGAVLYRSALIPVGIESYVVGLNTKGKPLDSLFLEPLPPASTYRVFNGRVLYVIGDVLGWSLALRPSITHLGKNRQRFPGGITMCEPITQDEQAGVWIAGRGRTWFIAGQDPNSADGTWALRAKHPYGAVPGSAVTVPLSAFNPEASGDGVFWLDTGGHFCLGSSGGQITRLAQNRYNAGLVEKAAAFYRERNGKRQVVMSARGAVVDRFSMSDNLSIKVFRDGKQIDG